MFLDVSTTGGICFLATIADSLLGFPTQEKDKMADSRKHWSKISDSSENKEEKWKVTHRQGNISANY